MVDNVSFLKFKKLKRFPAFPLYFFLKRKHGLTIILSLINVASQFYILVKNPEIQPDRTEVR